MSKSYTMRVGTGMIFSPLLNALALGLRDWVPNPLLPWAHFHSLKNRKNGNFYRIKVYFLPLKIIL